jgi:hypothetical protein
LTPSLCDHYSAGTGAKRGRSERGGIPVRQPFGTLKELEKKEIRMRKAAVVGAALFTVVIAGCEGDQSSAALTGPELQTSAGAQILQPDLICIVWDGTGACEDPPPPTSPPPPELSDPRLNVYIAGLGKVMVEDSITLTAHVSGGNGQYTYYWQHEVCWVGGFCGGPYPVVGSGSSVRVQVRSDWYEVRYSVLVKDSQPAEITGVGSHHVIAPGAWRTVEGVNWSCGTSPNYYPFTETRTGVEDKYKNRPYTRNTCSGGRIYQPRPGD